VSVSYALASEVRRSLTRFTATVLIAVFLEAIVLIFKVAEDDISLIIYPTLLLFAGVAMLLGLGVFQRMAVSVERAASEPAEKRTGKGRY
jgi:hypothetical protein